MTTAEKIDAVMDGLTGGQTVEGRLFGFWPYWPSVILHLSAAKVNAIMQTVLNFSSVGSGPEITGLSLMRCCGRPRVVVKTFYEPRFAAFERRFAKRMEVCSVCGDIVCRTSDG